MELTGAEIVTRCLAEEGVEFVFGFPGGAVLNIYDEIFKQNKFKHVLVRHEQAAVHAADAFARASGKVGVALVTSGPGVTNAVTGIATAYMDSIPMVIVTGQVPTPAIGLDAFQEFDTVGITRPIVKHNFLVKDVRELATTIKKAFHIARTGRPGPVVVDIPKDISLHRAPFHYPDRIEMRSTTRRARATAARSARRCNWVKPFNAAIAQMKADGYLDYLNNRWFFLTDPNGEDVYDQLPDLKGQKVAAVTENAYTPLNFVDPATGKAVGWEYDAVNEICRRLNCTVDWKLSSWDAMIPAVKDGQFDVGMDGITINDERKAQVDFSDPYMTSQQFMLVRADEDRFSNAQEFGANEELLVGVQGGHDELLRGFGRQDDALPARLTGEPFTTGPSQGKVSHMEEMLGEYYQARGWNSEGVPTDAKLRELGLRL